VTLEVLLAGHGPTAAPHCSSDQGHREKALHGRWASVGNSTRLCASRLLFAALSSQTTPATTPAQTTRTPLPPRCQVPFQCGDSWVGGGGVEERAHRLHQPLGLGATPWLC
jgi:hypothetical protein